MKNDTKPIWIKIISIISIMFGMATIKEGGTVLFTEEGRIAAGNFVPFVLWFNFIAGFFYIITGIAIYRLKACAKKLALVIAFSTLFIFILFAVHIINGGAYEVRTIWALTLRSSLWVLISITVLRSKLLNSTNCEC